MKILFVHNAKTRFVQMDLDILQSTHNVVELAFAPSPHYFATLAREIKACDVIYGWWVSAHLLPAVLLAKRFGKKIIIAGGDYDVIYKINHGWLRDKGRYWLGHLLFRLIDAFVVFSEYSLAKTLEHKHIRPSKVSVIPIGFRDIAKKSSRVKRPMILTVGTVWRTELYRKGLEMFARVSREMPDVEFILAGRWMDDAIEFLRQINDANIKYTGFVPDTTLWQMMSEAKVYTQLSSHEGFGCALAEAMLFECVPVVTERGAIPEVVGEEGIYVPFQDVPRTVQAIRAVLAQDGTVGSRARQRILARFPFEKRRNELLELVDNIATG